MPLNCPPKVAGVPMEIFRVSTYYKSAQGMSIVNMAAACPTGEPQNLDFTTNATTRKLQFRHQLHSPQQVASSSRMKSSHGTCLAV